MEPATLHPLPPDVLDEPETIDLRSSGAPIQTQSDPPTSPTPSPRSQ